LYQFTADHRAELIERTGNKASEELHESRAEFRFVERGRV